MSNANQAPGLKFVELNEDAAEPEDLSARKIDDDREQNKMIESQSEDLLSPSNSTVIAQQSSTDSNAKDIAMYEIVVDLSSLYTDPSVPIPNLDKLHSKVTNPDDAIFKEPQMMSVYKMKRKKKQAISKSDDLNFTKSSVKSIPEMDVDADHNDLQTCVNIQADTLNVDSNINPEPSSSRSNEKPEMRNEDQSDSTEERYSEPESSSNMDESVSVYNRKRVNLYASDTGPQMYRAKGNLVTQPIITKNLPKVFQYLPVCGKPGPNTTLKEFYKNKIREFIGCDLNDEEFEDVENYCSPELLKIGKEIKMQTTFPVMGLLTSSILQNNYITPDVNTDPPNLVTLTKNKLRLEKDNKGVNMKCYIKKLKYRGVRILPSSQADHNTDDSNQSTSSAEAEGELEPGLDILYKVRVYRPFTYSMVKDRYTRSRHSVFSCDVTVAGRQRLAALRDRIVCHNDFDLRVDVSNNPDDVLPSAKAKEVFPSGFLFINNVFYVDMREGCIDYSAPIREWAIKRKIGSFPMMDMGQVRLDQLVLKLGYPEVYVHQGNCEHVFLFSEVRLLNANDQMRLSSYPYTTAIGQNQTVYCTTCAEFSAKWIVVGSDRVPFDPGFFCDTCFKQYMYRDGQKIGNFKAYRYRGNAMNILKPL